MWECPDFLDLPERPAKPRRHGPTGDFIVLAEVGAKTGDVPVVAEQWLAEMDGDLAAGARWVIAEGRESGTVGLYHANGSVREDLVDVLASRLGLEQVIFEGWPQILGVALAGNGGEEPLVVGGHPVGDPLEMGVERGSCPTEACGWR